MIFFLSVGFAYGQGSGKFSIRNYTPREYKGQGQVFALLEDDQNILYFGNEGGLIEYDGVSFRYIPTKNYTTVRSIVRGKDGKIYVSAIGELGYLAPDSLGHLEYRSLLEHVPEDYRANINDVWKSIVTDNGMFFQMSRYIFRWHEGKMTVWEAKNSYHVLFQVRDQLYVRDAEIGLLRFNPESQTWELMPNGEFFAKERIYSALPYGEDQILLGTRDQGFFIVDQAGNLTPFKTEVDDWIIGAQLYCGLYDSANERYIFGTLRDGIIALDKEGRELFRINKKLGLQSEGVLILKQDKAGGLWAGLGYGLSRIALDLPVTQWDASLGLEGSVDEFTQHEGRYYAATGNGIYVSGNNGFQEVPGIATQCWDVISVTTSDGDTHLLASSNKGVYRVTPEGATQIVERDYTRQVRPAGHLADHFWAIHKDGLTLLAYQNGVFSAVREIKTPKTSIQTLVVDKKGDVWFATSVQGVGHLRFETDELGAFQFTPYDSFGGSQIAEQSYVHADQDGSVLILVRVGAYRYDPSQGKMEKDERFVLPPNHYLTNIVADSLGNYWGVVSTIESKSWLERIYPDPESKTAYLRDSTSFLSFTFNSVTSVYVEPSKKTVWALGGDGVFRYNFSEAYAPRLPKSLVRKVVSSKDDQVIFWGHFYNEQGRIIPAQLSNLIPELPYAQNALNFFCATPEYGEEDALMYSFWLEGHDKNWSSWSMDTKKEYTNLFEGSYKLQVRSRDRYGNISGIGIYEFRVLPPWYRTYPAIVAYFLLGSLLLWVTLRLNTRRLKNEQYRLESIVRERTQEVELSRQETLRQKQQVEESRKEIAAQKDQLEVSYQNVKLLSEIGKEITSIVEIEELIEITYEKVNQLMDASGFGIGVHNPETNKIEIRGFIEKGEKLPPDEDDMNDDRLSVWCLKNNRSVFINSREEINQYLPNKKYVFTGHGDRPESIIYMPLRYEGQVRGVVTVQSFQPNAYATYDLNIVENLANYISISIENALLYENLEEKVRQRTAEVVRQHQEIEEKSRLLEQKNQDIEEQKLLIEKKNQDITSSINYAKRIQDAMLPTVAEVRACLKDSFIFFRPRDIISGDFYWFTHFNHPTEGEKIVIAAVDCTGHGVPGAFMSMIGNELLNEIVNLVGETDPGQILSKLHKGVRKDLRQYENDNRDGMDMAICVIDRAKKTLDFAGAKNPLIYVQGGEFHQIRGDKFPIGGRQQKQNHRQFTTHRISFQQPTTFYIYTDGYQDQFGGPENKKFNTSRFRSLLYNIHFLPMHEQREVLETTFRDWTDDKRQIDDVLVVGFSL